jgi:hypothetical protein
MNEQDELNQQKLILGMSKNMMFFSFVNLGLLLFWGSPFLICYFIIGPESFFNLFLSWHSIIIMVFICIVSYLKFKVL